MVGVLEFGGLCARGLGSEKSHSGFAKVLDNTSFKRKPFAHVLLVLSWRAALLLGSVPALRVCKSKTCRSTDS